MAYGVEMYSKALTNQRFKAMQKGEKKPVFVGKLTSCPSR